MARSCEAFLERHNGAWCSVRGEGAHWGDVYVAAVAGDIDGDWADVYSCEGHADMLSGGGYEGPPSGCPSVRDDECEDRIKSALPR